jgi:hypothetical protein
MRFTKLALGVVGVGALAASAVAGCGSSTGSTSTSAATSSSSSGGPSCAPAAACMVADKTCLGLTDNTGKTTFGLRMSELDVVSPMALATGGVAMQVSGAVTQNDTTCNLNGTGLFTWLLQFNTTAGTLETGGGWSADPTTGYSFINLTSPAIAPITVMAPIGEGGTFGPTAPQDLTVPIFLAAPTAAMIQANMPDLTDIVLLPLSQASITMGTLSTSQNCIGSYNAAGLQPSNSCDPDSTHPQFLDGGKLDGFITLANADNVNISLLMESLCVLLAGPTYSDMKTPIAHCTKDTTTGAYLYQGNWCSTTNSAGGCADSVSLSANFAASSVTITP